MRSLRDARIGQRSIRNLTFQNQVATCLIASVCRAWLLVICLLTFDTHWRCDISSNYLLNKALYFGVLFSKNDEEAEFHTMTRVLEEFTLNLINT
jgi:hypothetical protein